MRRALVLLALLAARPVAAKFSWSGHVDVDAEGLKSDDEKKQLEAVAALGNDDMRIAAPHLLRVVRDDQRAEKVREAAAKALGTGGVVEAVPDMIEWLKDAAG